MANNPADTYYALVKTVGMLNLPEGVIVNFWHNNYDGPIEIQSTMIDYLPVLLSAQITEAVQQLLSYWPTNGMEPSELWDALTDFTNYLALTPGSELYNIFDPYLPRTGVTREGLLDIRAYDQQAGKIGELEFGDYLTGDNIALAIKLLAPLGWDVNRLCSDNKRLDENLSDYFYHQTPIEVWPPLLWADYNLCIPGTVNYGITEYITQLIKSLNSEITETGVVSAQLNDFFYRLTDVLEVQGWSCPEMIIAVSDGLQADPEVPPLLDQPPVRDLWDTVMTLRQGLIVDRPEGAIGDIGIPGSGYDLAPAISTSTVLPDEYVEWAKEQLSSPLTAEELNGIAQELGVVSLSPNPQMAQTQLLNYLSE